MYNMMRIIAGTLIEVGRGERSPENIPSLFGAQRESAGFLARRPHPDSRRAFLIDLTPLGQEKADAVCARLAVWDEELLAGFSEEELEWLRDALRRMNDNLERNTR